MLACLFVVLCCEYNVQQEYGFRVYRGAYGYLIRLPLNDMFYGFTSVLLLLCMIEYSLKVQTQIQHACLKTLQTLYSLHYKKSIGKNSLGDKDY